MAKSKVMFEKDEKKSIIIAIIVSIIVILAVVLAFVAIKRYKNEAEKKAAQNTETEVQTETDETTVVEGNSIVKNQEELNKALADKSATAILIQTDETQTIVIPSGDYGRISLVVDAPYTEVTNYGTFESITLKQIASNTWTESASGNSIVADAPSCHVVVPSGISISSMKTIQAGSSLAVEAQGTIALLSIEAEDSIVSIQVDGELSQLMIYEKTNLKLSGSTHVTTPVEAAYGADDTVITSSIPLDVSSFAGITLEYMEGAEGSTLKIADETAGVALKNNTTEDVVVTRADGKKKKVRAGKEYNREGVANSGTGEAQTTENNTGDSPDSGNSEGSTASSSSNSSGSSSNRSTGSSHSTTGTIIQSSAKNTSSSTGSNANNATTNNGTSTANNSTSTKTYTKKQVEKMINAAVADADKQAQSKIDSITGNTITKDEAQKLINQAVLDAQNAAEQEKQNQIQNAVNTALSKPVIVSFVDEAYVYAGVEGNLPGEDELPLPKEVYGCTGTGERYTIAVKNWINTDYYSETVPAGAYRFTAVLEPSAEYNVAAGVAAYATVNVRPVSADSFITYKNAGYSQSISVTEYRMNDYENVQQTYPEAYYVIENKSASDVIYTSLDFCYYDSAGVAVDHDSWYGLYIQPGKSWIAYRSKPCVEYAYYVVEVNNYTGSNGKVDSFSNIGLRDSSTLELYTRGGNTISECNVMILYLGADRKTAYGMEAFSSGGTDSPSINSATQDSPLIFNLRIPDRADIYSSIIVSKGGYE